MNRALWAIALSFPLTALATKCWNGPTNAKPNLPFVLETRRELFRVTLAETNEPSECAYESIAFRTGSVRRPHGTAPVVTIWFNRSFTPDDPPEERLLALRRYWVSEKKLVRLSAYEIKPTSQGGCPLAPIVEKAEASLRKFYQRETIDSSNDILSSFPLPDCSLSTSQGAWTVEGVLPWTEPSSSTSPPTPAVGESINALDHVRELGAGAKPPTEPAIGKKENAQLAAPSTSLRFGTDYLGRGRRETPESRHVELVSFGPKSKDAFGTDEVWFYRSPEVAGASIDTAVYTKTPDGFLVSYLPEHTFRFEFAENTYECVDGDMTPKRFGPNLQRLHRIVRPSALGKLKEIGRHEEFGAIFVSPNATATIDEFYSTYLNHYKIFADQSSSSHSEEGAEGQAPKIRKSVPPALTREAFLKKKPVVYVKDAIDRTYDCRAVSLLPDITGWVEPIVYVYSDSPRPISVSLGPEMELWKSIPPSSSNSWTFTADEKSHLRFSDGRIFPFLFWEGRGSTLPRLPRSGEVVQREEVELFLKRELPRLGLRGREIRDFMHYWVPVLSREPAVLVEFLLNEELERYAPLRTTLPSAQVLRVYVNHRPWPPDEPAPPRKTLPTQVRRANNVIVEWGGMHWAESE